MQDQELLNHLTELKGVTAGDKLRKKIQLRISALPQKSSNHFLPQLVAPALIALIALLLVGGGTIVARNSRPGDLLYPLKTAIFRQEAEPTPAPTPVASPHPTPPDTATPSAGLKPSNKPQDQLEEEPREEKERGNSDNVLGEKDVPAQQKREELDKKTELDEKKDWRRFIPPGLLRKLEKEELPEETDLEMNALFKEETEKKDNTDQKLDQEIKAPGLDK